MRTFARVGVVGWLGVMVTTALGCSGEGPVDGGPDGGEGPKITVSGTVAVHPDALAWLASVSQPAPALEGLTAQVEEPVTVAFGDPAGGFGAQILAGGGAFSIPEVPSDGISLGVAVRVRDEAPAGKR